MTDEQTPTRSRYEALAAATQRNQEEAEAAWPRKAKALAKKAPSEAARAAFELAAALPASERVWLRTQLG